MRTEFDDIFMARVKKKREKLGLTQHDLAVIAGRSRETIAAIETGQQRVLLSDGVLIARVLGIDLNKIPLSKEAEAAEQLIPKPKDP